MLVYWLTSPLLFWKQKNDQKFSTYKQKYTVQLIKELQKKTPEGNIVTTFLVYVFYFLKFRYLLTEMKQHIRHF